MSPKCFKGRPHTQYLPPAGAYYDQFDIPPLFGPNAPKKGLCRHCLLAECECIEYPAGCPNACGMCGCEGEHAKDLCTMAYCSYKWCKDLGCVLQPDDMAALRPGRNQIAELHGLGLIQFMFHVLMDVLPNMESAEVKEFYAGHAVQHSHRIRARAPIVWIKEDRKKSAAAHVKTNPSQITAATVIGSPAADLRIPNLQTHNLPFINSQLAQAIRQVTEEPTSHPQISIPGLSLQPWAIPDNKMQLQLIPPDNVITIPSSPASDIHQGLILPPTVSLQLHYEKLLHERDNRELQYIAESKEKDRVIRALKAKLG